MSNGGICFFSRDCIWIPIRLENLQLQFVQLDWDWIRISLRVEIYVKWADLFCQQGLDWDFNLTVFGNIRPTGGFVFSVGIGLGFASDQKICNFSFFSQTRIGFGFHCVSKSMSNGLICFFSRDWIWIPIRLENLQLQFFQLDWDQIRISLRVEIYVKRGDLFFQQGLDWDLHPIRKSATLVFSARLGLDSDFTACRNLCQTGGFVFSVGIGFGFPSDQKIYNFSFFSQIGIRFGFDYVSKSMSNGRICFFSMDWIWIGSDQKICNFSFFSQIGIGFGFHCMSKSMSNGLICFFRRDWIWICIRLENLQLQFVQLDWDWIRISLRVEIYVQRGDLFFQQGLDWDLHPIRKSATLVFLVRLGLDSDFTACRNLCQTRGFVFSVGIGFGFVSDQKIYNFSFFSQIRIGFGFHCVSKSMSNGGICFFSRDWIWIPIRLENLQLQFFQLDWDQIRISLRVEIYVKRGDLFFQQGLDLDLYPIRKSTTLVFLVRLGLDSDFTACRNLCQTGGFVFSVGIGFGFPSDQKIYNFSFFSQIGIRFGFHYVSKSMSNTRSEIRIQSQSS